MSAILTRHKIEKNVYICYILEYLKVQRKTIRDLSMLIEILVAYVQIDIIFLQEELLIKRWIIFPSSAINDRMIIVFGLFFFERFNNAFGGFSHNEEIQ